MGKQGFARQLHQRAIVSVPRNTPPPSLLSKGATRNWYFGFSEGYFHEKDNDTPLWTPLHDAFHIPESNMVLYLPKRERGEVHGDAVLTGTFVDATGAYSATTTLRTLLNALAGVSNVRLVIDDNSRHGGPDHDIEMLVGHALQDHGLRVGTLREQGSAKTFLDRKYS